jgi:V/A-type H+-transporting ATPase subunit K
MDEGIRFFAAALAVGIAAIGTGWAQSRIGSAGVGALAEKPDLRNTVILLVAIPETMIVLGFVVAAMILFL